MVKTYPIARIVAASMTSRMVFIVGLAGRRASDRRSTADRRTDAVQDARKSACNHIDRHPESSPELTVTARLDRRVVVRKDAYRTVRVGTFP